MSGQCVHVVIIWHLSLRSLTDCTQRRQPDLATGSSSSPCEPGALSAWPFQVRIELRRYEARSLASTPAGPLTLMSPHFGCLVISLHRAEARGKSFRTAQTLMCTGGTSDKTQYFADKGHLVGIPRAFQVEPDTWFQVQPETARQGPPKVRQEQVGIRGMVKVWLFRVGPEMARHPCRLVRGVWPTSLHLGFGSGGDFSNSPPRLMYIPSGSSRDVSNAPWSPADERLFSPQRRRRRRCIFPSLRGSDGAPGLRV